MVESEGERAPVVPVVADRLGQGVGGEQGRLDDGVPKVDVGYYFPGGRLVQVYAGL